MNTLRGFICAAAPWAAMGLLLAIFVSRGAAKKQSNTPSDVRHSEGGTQA